MRGVLRKKACSVLYIALYYIYLYIKRQLREYDNVQ